MTRKLQITFGILFIVAFAISLTPIRPWLEREVKHYVRYKKVAASGMNATVIVSVNSIKNGVADCSAVITNTGTQLWPQDKQYFALGIFERNSQFDRVETNIKLIDGSNRVIIHQNVSPGTTVPLNFKVAIPSTEPCVFHCQMVQENVTWLGQEVEVTAEE